MKTATFPQERFYRSYAIQDAPDPPLCPETKEPMTPGVYRSGPGWAYRVYYHEGSGWSAKRDSFGRRIHFYPPGDSPVPTID